MIKYEDDFNEHNAIDGDDESLNIHEIIKNSSIHKRDVAHPFSISKKKEALKKSKYKLFYENLALLIEEKIIDRSIGFFERYRHKKGKGFSVRALNEFLEYYENLYQEENPDIEEFYKLLKRNGTPDMANPFNEGNNKYYSYHPLGFVAADLATLLEGMHSSMEEGLQFLEEIDNKVKKEKHRDKKEWLTFFDFLDDAEQDRLENKENNQKLALLSWALVLSLGDSLENLKKEVHPDNLEVATIETLFIVEEKDLPGNIKLKDIANGAIKLGILDEFVANKILEERILIDQKNKGEIVESVNNKPNSEIHSNFTPMSPNELAKKISKNK